jgi:hypothetical protein
MFFKGFKTASRARLSAAVLAAGAGVGLMGATTSAYASQTIATDLIVQGSLCVGMDCVTNESFGFDTMRLKENNLRIHFQDTSNSGSFPTNDWRIVINDSSNGGAEYFAVEDSTAGRIPFRILAGAPANSLYVHSSGRIGVGTSTPTVEMHVSNGDTPTLRLEQNGSSGFQAQTWDIAGNETNFFVRDVTNGSRLSFRIRPGAPESSIDIAANGFVGFGTSSPSAPIHISRSDGEAELLVQNTAASVANRKGITLVNNGSTRLTFVNTQASNGGPVWSLDNGQNFLIRDRTNDIVAVSVAEATGDMTIAGELTTSGTTCGTGCDEVFEPDYPIMPISERAALMYELGYLPNVGPTIENEPFNMTQKVGRMLNELEHAHIYIAQLEQRLTALERAQQQGG